MRVGVVGTVKHFRLSEDPLDEAYMPYQQRPLIFTEVVVRAAGDPAAVANSIRAAVWRVDRDQPVWRVRTMNRVLDEARGGPSFRKFGDPSDISWVTSSQRRPTMAEAGRTRNRAPAPLSHLGC